ncbi:anaerobic dehydrogenase, typically selenocysteine-containing [Mycobacterium sp. JS623]|uniref:molybdopterin-dependent oxidoreductase n=1 Tax=Mycobacterium sp. JS623 TaxID=212767 RepID=UPI0002A5B9E7|nr:molybdopterin-dependent oxidoreductase [Mycobacterium sp. JS623]AGB22276.1 anaerobic dehydrogenase, typically selenocysteine-containing [Mycobacterium sp. JS623]
MVAETKRTATATHWGNYTVLSDNGRVVSLEPTPEDSAPSPIGSGMASAHRDAVRITQPMVREGWLAEGPGPARGRRGRDRFVPVPHDFAVDLVAAEIERVRGTFGNAAIYAGSYGWASAGRFHHAKSQIHRFMGMAGGYVDSVNTYSVGALEVIMPHVIGGLPMSISTRGPTYAEIAAEGELVVSFGGLARKNAAICQGGIGDHVVPALQDRCRAAGVRFVNVSPVRSDSDDALGGDWLPIRPGSDVALMLGLAYEIVVSDHHDKDFLNRCCVGFEAFADYLLGRSDGVQKDAKWASRLTEIDATTIRSLATKIATSRTVINVSWSLQRMDHGEQAHWMGLVLSAISGSLGRRGGGFAAGLGTLQIGVRRGSHPKAALSQGENPVKNFIPVARIADMLLFPGDSFEYNGRSLHYPDIRMIYWAGGNPFHHHQDLHRLVRAWQRPETVIVHESWWNANARFADIVFPIATSLEREDIASGSSDTTLSAMHRAVEPPSGVVTDYEIFSDLATRLGFRDQFTEGRDASAWVRELYERTRTGLAETVEIPPFDTFWQQHHVTLPEPADPQTGSFMLLRDDPERHPLDTPSGKIEITSATIAEFGYDDCPAHPKWIEPREWLGAPSGERSPLHLVSNQPSRRLHSQYDNGSYSRAGKVADREPMQINPLDANKRGILSGEVVRLWNSRGSCLAGAVITDDVRPGVVVLATGAWFDPEDPGVSGSLDRHGNPNVLTADVGTSRLAQASSSGTTLIEIEPVDGSTAPQPRAFVPPDIVEEREAVQLLRTARAKR